LTHPDFSTLPTAALTVASSSSSLDSMFLANDSANGDAPSPFWRSSQSAFVIDLKTKQEQGPMLKFWNYFRKNGVFDSKQKLSYAKMPCYYWFLRKTPIFSQKIVENSKQL
jgi:hypothetical protein